METISATEILPRVVSISRRASKDLSGVYGYAVHYWGVTGAEEYLDALGKAMQQVAEHAIPSTQVSNASDTRVFAGQGKNVPLYNRVFFRETNEGIYVLRVLDEYIDFDADDGQPFVLEQQEPEELDEATLAAIDEALAELDRGETVTLEEAKIHLQQHMRLWREFEENYQPRY